MRKFSEWEDEMVVMLEGLTQEQKDLVLESLKGSRYYVGHNHFPYGSDNCLGVIYSDADYWDLSKIKNPVGGLTTLTTEEAVYLANSVLGSTPSDGITSEIKPCEEVPTNGYVVQHTYDTLDEAVESYYNFFKSSGVSAATIGNSDITKDDVFEKMIKDIQYTTELVRASYQGGDLYELTEGKFNSTLREIIKSELTQQGK